MQTYYADAIPLPVLQREQTRLRGSLLELDREADAVDAALSGTLGDELAILEVLEDVVGMYRVADGIDGGLIMGTWTVRGTRHNRMDGFLPTRRVRTRVS